MSGILQAYLVLRQFSHQICYAPKKLNDYYNLSTYEILQELLELIEDLLQLQ